MASQLSISTSYLNLIERNQRPVSAKVLLKMAETYAVFHLKKTFNLFKT